VARKKLTPVPQDERELIGALLRDLRRASGRRSVESAAADPDCPASRPTIYAYERGGLVPSLAQFLDLVTFYVVDHPVPATGKPEDDLRAQGIAAVARALTLEAYQMPRAMALMARMQPEPGRRT
jgi:Helix-turn-helix domain